MLRGNPYIVWLYEWDKASGQWVNKSRFELTYDGAGNQIQEMVYEWDTIGNQWLVAAQFDMTYDGDGNLLLEEWSLLGRRQLETDPDI